MKINRIRCGHHFSQVGLMPFILATSEIAFCLPSRAIIFPLMVVVALFFQTKYVHVCREQTCENKCFKPHNQQKSKQYSSPRYKVFSLQYLLRPFGISLCGTILSFFCLKHEVIVVPVQLTLSQ